MGEQLLKAHKKECNLMCRQKIYPGSGIVFKGLFPAGGTETPAVARLQAEKTRHGHRGREIVALVFGKFKKIFSYLDTDTMYPYIITGNFTAAFPGKAGHWLYTANFKWSAKDISMFSHLFSPKQYLSYNNSERKICAIVTC